MVTKKIVCLANSFRPGGSCVAGIEIVNGQYGDWIRPISHRANEAISDFEKTYADGTRLALLDVIEISFDAHRPEHHQTENWLISRGVKWRKLRTASRDELLGAVIPQTAPLWLPAQSTNRGLNDKIATDVAQNFTCSLALIKPETADVEVSVNRYNPDNPKTEIWVEFSWSGIDHKMKLTDPVQFERFKTGGGGCHRLKNPFLCISLAEVWEQNQSASMLVAGLIP